MGCPTDTIVPDINEYAPCRAAVKGYGNALCLGMFYCIGNRFLRNAVQLGHLGVKAFLTGALIMENNRDAALCGDPLNKCIQ